MRTIILAALAALACALGGAAAQMAVEDFGAKVGNRPVEIVPNGALMRAGAAQAGTVSSKFR